MYPLASAKDREGGATTRYEAYTGMRVTNYRNMHTTAATTRYAVSMRIIARSRVLGLRGVDVGRIYSLASVKDRKSGASRPICQRAPGVTNYRNIHPRPASCPLAATVR